jgi:hypothetical protein
MVLRPSDRSSALIPELLASDGSSDFSDDSGIHIQEKRIFFGRY